MKILPAKVISSNFFGIVFFQKVEGCIMWNVVCFKEYQEKPFDFAFQNCLERSELELGITVRKNLPHFYSLNNARGLSQNFRHLPLQLLQTFWVSQFAIHLRRMCKTCKMAFVTLAKTSDTQYERRGKTKLATISHCKFPRFFSKP